MKTDAPLLAAPAKLTTALAASIVPALLSVTEDPVNNFPVLTVPSILPPSRLLMTREPLASDVLLIAAPPVLIRPALSITRWVFAPLHCRAVWLPGTSSVPPASTVNCTAARDREGSLDDLAGCNDVAGEGRIIVRDGHGCVSAADDRADRPLPTDVICRRSCSVSSARTSPLIVSVNVAELWPSGIVPVNGKRRRNHRHWRCCRRKAQQW